jgi:predicted Zn-dependent protease
MTRRTRAPRFLLARALAVAGMTTALACATNPVSGKRELALISESQEIEMGRQGAAEVTATIGLYANGTLQGYVNRIGQTLAATTERPRLPWEFHVVDDASVNAFALPGGFIFVTRGLLAHMTTEAELASVLGHESGHVAARHSVQQMSRQQVAAIGLGVGSVLSPAIAKYGQVAGAGLGLMFLKYGRDDETQADRLGFRYALADGYDTRQMISVFEMLQRAEQLAGGGRLPEWQSTHPDPGNRIAAVQALVAATSQDLNAMKIGGAEFLRQIDGMVYGVNPRAGFFRGPLFLHPDLKFVFQFPDGWKTHNGADAVAAISTDESALIELRGAQGSAAEAARVFFSQQGMTAAAQSRGTIHGNPVVSAEFTAQDGQGGSVRGIAAFFEYGAATWRTLAYTTAARYEAWKPAFQRSINSFDRLTDPVALAVQPLRLRIDAAPRAMSLSQFNAQLPSSISFAELALINGVPEGAQLFAGQSIKRVIGTPMTQVGGRQ